MRLFLKNNCFAGTTGRRVPGTMTPLSTLNSAKLRCKRSSGVPWRRFLNVAMINSALRAPAGSRNSVIYIDQYYTVYSAEIASAGWRDSAIYWTVYTDQYSAVTALAGSYVSAITTATATASRYRYSRSETTKQFNLLFSINTDYCNISYK